jgi:hypothetical protein
MIGLNTENAPVMMNWMPTMAQRVRCHCAVAVPSAAVAPGSSIPPALSGGPVFLKKAGIMGMVFTRPRAEGEGDRPAIIVRVGVVADNSFIWSLSAAGLPGW